MELFEAIMTRRSIRRYKTQPVEEEKLKQVLEAARWAPSWANTQCWRFIVVRDTGIKDRLAEMIGKNAATEAVRMAPVVIVACAELGKAGYYGGVPGSDQGDWYMYDIALAMHNLCLTAHALGLGTVQVGLHFDTGKAADILGVPPGFRAVIMTPLGYPDAQPQPRPRKELSEIVFYDRWGHTAG